ncbi:hypothetical protein P9209_29180 [Prescottella defluvii]|nr:hypothetical protein P9209_29180 [Prescottella defluvii]
MNRRDSGADEEARSVEAKLAMDNAGKALVFLVCIALGVTAGFLLPWLGGIAADYPIPFGGAIEALASFDNPAPTAGRPLIGAAAGVVFAMVLIGRSPQYTVTDDCIRIRIGNDSRRLPRTKVAGVYRQDGKLIIESAEGRRLFEGDVEGSRDHVKSAFVQHGYPWEGDD